MVLKWPSGLFGHFAMAIGISKQPMVSKWQVTHSTHLFGLHLKKVMQNLVKCHKDETMLKRETKGHTIMKTDN